MAEKALETKPGVREFRANLSAYLCSGKPTVVKKGRKVVALVVPVQAYKSWNVASRREAHKALKDSLAAAADCAFTKQDLV